MIVLTLNQQLLYLVQSSYGLFLVGFLALGQFLWHRRRSGLANFVRDVPSTTLLFFILAWLGSLLLSGSIPRFAKRGRAIPYGTIC